MPAGGINLNKRQRYRNYNLKFSNKWHDTNELTVVDEGYKAACESKGIRVYDAQVGRHFPTLKKPTVCNRKELLKCNLSIVLLPFTGGNSVIFT